MPENHGLGARANAWLQLLVYALVGLTSVTGSDVRAQPKEPVTARIIDLDLHIRLPLQRCGAPAFLAVLARALSIPAGLEYVAEPCNWRNVSTEERISLRGLAVADALNELTRLDTTYEWREIDGVIVMRPVVAWRNRQHFLEREISGFSLEENNIGEALGALRVVFGQPSTPGDVALGNRSSEGQRIFSVAPGRTTAINILNAVVRTHGSLHWEVEYCERGSFPHHAKLWLATSDGTRIGTHHTAAPATCR
jgi:hypothetical protein